MQAGGFRGSKIFFGSTSAKVNRAAATVIRFSGQPEEIAQPISAHTARSKSRSKKVSSDNPEMSAKRLLRFIAKQKLNRIQTFS
jgi:hypothetical protein